MADEEKRITRSQSTTSNQSSWLGLGNYIPYGREARIARSPQVSPNPSSSIATDTQQFFPSPESRSLPPLTEPILNMADGTNAIQSLSTALSGLQVSSRKPDLPPFDKNSIDKWIRRVESAYIRAGISAPIEKFAFIESKFPVDEDPAVDEFLFGEATAENWTAFCDYLKRRYGKTKRQKAAAVLEPLNMDGRTPSQYFAKLRQSYDDITFDDIIKEICVRQLPQDLQQTICKDTEAMSAKDMMNFADKYYNPDGSRLHRKPQSINAVKANNNTSASSSTFSTPFQDDNNDDDNSQTDINAIRGRNNQQRGRQQQSSFNNNRSKSRGRSFGGGSGGYNNNNGARGGFNNSQNKQQQQHDPTMCFYHNTFGDRAKKCDIGCSKQKSGNGLGPRQ